MSEKHTPGPWRVIDRWYIGKPETGTFAEVKCCRGIAAEDEPQHAANARLIAAAPDLLEACKEMHRTLTSPSRQLLDSTRRELEPWLPMLTAAIAKAEATGAEA